MKENHDLLRRIKELTKNAPPNWAEIAAREMGKSQNSIYAYARGERGVRRGMHKEVFKILSRLVEQKKAETKSLLIN